ncbi:unnamed protein product [Auanema sp. JU1783]|nr:unnamed protein product [Auanema sp. JU1783]
MFRKPKKKVVARQPIGSGWDESENDISVQESKETDDGKANDENETLSIPSKPPALLSFDHDEGADADFTVKKNTKQVDEMKRQIKLEVECLKIEEDGQFVEVIKKENSHDSARKPLNRKKYLEKYRTSHQQAYSDESDIEIQNDVSSKFGMTFDGIPDSKAVFEAKKKRERLRREKDGIIPLEETAREKNVRERLVREDDHDDSDEDHGRFYSLKQLTKEEEERRRDEQNEFLEREQGDDDRDPEDDEWETQQIQKAVSRQTIGRMRPEYDISSKNLQAGLVEYRQTQQQQQEVDMDIDFDYEQETHNPRTTVLGVPNTGGVITIEDIVAKLDLRIKDTEDQLKATLDDKDRLIRNIEENTTMIRKNDIETPDLARKFTMNQELKIFIRNLLDCLNEKVADINILIDRRRHCLKSRSERLMRRRRKDVQDQYAECSALASGKPIQSMKTGETVSRVAEREARRGRRRRERENTLSGISHEEGLSSDDEEPTSTQLHDKSIIDECVAGLDTVFVDAADEFSNLRKVLDRILDWLAVDEQSFQDAYVALCIPKLCSPFVRIQLSKINLLEDPNFTYSTNQWYIDCLLAGVSHNEIQSDHPIIVNILPKVFEKVIVPYFTDIVNDEWDPTSLKQSVNLNLHLRGLAMFPTITAKSKPYLVLMESIKKKITQSIDEDLCAVMFSKQAVENPNTGCRAFIDRQYWVAIKLIRCINALKETLSPESRFELIVENVVNKACVLGLQFGLTNDVSCERKVKALAAELLPAYAKLGGEHSFRSLTICLNKVMNDQKEAGRDFHKDIQKILNILARSDN